jgi:hypothetical protein
MATLYRLVGCALVGGFLSAGCGDDTNTASDGSGSGATGGTGSGATGSGATGPGGSGAGSSGGSGGSGAGSSGGSGGAGSVTSWHVPSLKASVYFSPTDDLEDRVIAELEAAQSQIRLAFFNIRLNEIRDLLDQKVSAGVDVHVILDAKTQAEVFNTMGEELVALGVPVTLVQNDSATDATMHDKFAVIDGKIVMTGSANYSTTALNVSDEDLLFMDNPDLASRYLTEFSELVAGGNATSTPYAANTALQAYMGPEDNLDEIAQGLLDGAQTSAVMALFQLNNSTLIGAITDAHDRGVNVVVILDKDQADDAASTSDETLTAAGVPVILVDNTGNMAAEMHSKFLVVDHQQVLMGSYNWTNLGSYFNDENVVLIDNDHLAARVEGKFAYLLDHYPGPTPASLGLTTGLQTVSFDVSNVTLGAGATLTLRSVGGGPFPNPVPLNGTSFSTTIATGTQFDYVYEIRDGNTVVLAESGSHTFTVPYAPGPFAITDAFIE